MEVPKQGRFKDYIRFSEMPLTCSVGGLFIPLLRHDYLA